MSIIYTTETGFNRAKKFLTDNQYLFTWKRTGCGWLIRIK